MAINSLSDFSGCQVEELIFYITGTRTTVANNLFSMFGLASTAGTGTLAGTSTASGIVPTDLTTGCPIIQDFPTSGVGYITNIHASCSTNANYWISDLLFKAGAYSFNASQTLSGQPSFASRCPDYTGGSAYGKGNRIIYEQVTAATGNQSVAVTYTNQDGTTGRTTGTIGTGADYTVGRCLVLPLQGGDTGVQMIESVTGTVASAGTFNILVVRPLFMYKQDTISNNYMLFDAIKLGMPIIYQDSALAVYVYAPGTSSGTAFFTMEIRSK
jgi:hypothetical protein